MPEKIFVIGNSIKPYADTLKENGRIVERFSETSKALKKINDANLIVIDKDNTDSLKELLKSSSTAPKIVINRSTSSKGMGQWLRQPLVYPFHEPEGKEFVLFASKLLKEQAMLQKIADLEDSVAEFKEKLGFFEELNRALTNQNEIETILGIIMKRVRHRTDAKSWSIIMVDEDTGDLVIEKASGPGSNKVKKLRLKPGEGIAGWVAKNKKPVVVAEARKDKRFSLRVDRYSNHKTKSLMCVPIIVKDNMLGVLEVINKSDNSSFTKSDLDILTGFVEKASIAIESTSLRQKLEELVITDDLTKLFNTRHLHRSIESEVLRCKRYSTSVSLIFMDLDHFKSINDNHGHLIGSKLLVEIGQILIAQLRSVDSVARYGGDEFVIVLPQTILNNAMKIAERIRKAIENHTFLKGELNLRMTASFGVASYPESARSKEELLRLADESMYAVKRNTRNSVYAIIL